MDEGGVDIAFLSAWCGPGGWLITNAEVALAVNHAPDRLFGLLSVDLGEPMISPRDCLAALDRLDLDDRARALFLEGAARQVFKLPESPIGQVAGTGSASRIMAASARS
jgi:hypothetical protein